MWRFKIDQVWEKACRTVAPPHGQEAAMREVTRVVHRMDFASDQLEQVALELKVLLETFKETKYLSTLPGIGWTRPGLTSSGSLMSSSRSSGASCALTGAGFGGMSANSAEAIS